MKYLDSDVLSYLWQKIKTAVVTDIAYDSSTKKIQKTKNGSASDVVTLSTVATSGSYDDLSDKPTIPEGIVYRDYILTGSFTAGTIGTRGVQVNKSNEMDGSYSIVGMVLTYIGDSSKYLPLPFPYNGKIYCNFYRCTANAVSDCNVTVRVLYAKI